MIGHPYPSYRPSGVEWLGDIPEHWNVRRLGTVLIETVGGGTPDTSNEAFWADKDDPALSWVTISDMSAGGEITTTAKKVTSLGRTAARLRPLPSGTVIYSMYASVGAVARLATTAATNQAILGLIPGAMLKSSFLYWWLTGIRTAVLAQTRDNTQSNLNAETVRMIPVVLPPIAEQRTIADYLDTETARIDTLISKKRRLIELLAERKTLAAEDALVRLRESEKSIPLKYLVNESNIRCGTNQESGLLSVSIHHGVVPKNLESSNQAVSEDLTTYKLCHPGDIIVNRMRAFQGGLGVSPQRGIVSPDYTVLRVGSRASPRYLHFLMRSSWFVSEMTKRLRGIGATDQGQVRTPRINFADMGLIEVPVPSRDKQDELATDLTRQDAQITQLVDLQKKQLDLLAERRQALITTAVTGEVKVLED